jgi:HSP20 family protein
LREDYCFEHNRRFDMSNLSRWSPFDELTNWWPRSLFNRDVFSALRPDGTMSVEWNPRCDVSETDTEVIVHAELPGVEAKDMEVSVSEGMLTVRGEKRTETTEEKDEGRTYRERFFGSFERRLSIPANVDADKVDAKLTDGVLEVRLPKVKPVEPAVKKVEIKSE